MRDLRLPCPIVPDGKKSEVRFQFDQSLDLAFLYVQHCGNMHIPRFRTGQDRHPHSPSRPIFLNINYEEVKECFMAMFILFYMITMWKYFVQVKAEPADNLAPGIDTASGTSEAHGIPES